MATSRPGTFLPTTIITSRDVHHAAEIGHSAAVGTAHHNLNERADQSHQEGQPGADPYPGEQVPSHGVGAEPVGSVRRHILHGRRNVNVVLSTDGGSKQDKEEQNAQHCHGGNGDGILPQANPGPLPEGNGGAVNFLRVEPAAVHAGSLSGSQGSHSSHILPSLSVFRPQSGCGDPQWCTRYPSGTPPRYKSQTESRSGP